jgi:iron-sulfur cluster assembly protein
MSGYINLTSAAAAHIQKEIKKYGAIGMRLSVVRAGCSELKYIVNYVYTDHSYGKPVYDKDGIAIFIASKDIFILQKVQKLTIDYVRQGLNSRLKFINEKETDRCGCGESFAID